MAVKNTAKVIIGGKIITLGGYESEEYFQKVASYINKKMDELSGMPGYSRQPMETKHTLLSLNITDDYFKAKKQAEVFEQDLQQKDQEARQAIHIRWLYITRQLKHGDLFRTSTSITR